MLLLGGASAFSRKTRGDVGNEAGLKLPDLSSVSFSERRYRWAQAVARRHRGLRPGIDFWPGDLQQAEESASA